MRPCPPRNRVTKRTRGASRHPSLVNKVAVRGAVSACDDPVLQRTLQTHHRVAASASGVMGGRVVVAWVYCSFWSLGYEPPSFLIPGTLARGVAGPARVYVRSSRRGLVPRCWKADSCLRERCEYGGMSCNRAIDGPHHHKYSPFYRGGGAAMS